MSGETTPYKVNLLSLPTEVIQTIANHVPTSSLISLKLTSRLLFLQLTSPPQGYMKTANDCETRAIRRYLSERQEAAGGRRKCVLCGGLMPLAFFRDHLEPVCRWHDGWFGKVLSIEDTVNAGVIGEATTTGIGKKVKRLLCVHCRQIRAWDIEICPCKKRREECDSCGVFEVDCFVRSTDSTITIGLGR